MTDLQLATLKQGVAGVDQAIELLQTVSRSLHREAEQLEQQQQGGTEDDREGAHRERRGPTSDQQAG